MFGNGDAMGDELPPAIYHEKQVGSMCGQHCLNNLLQGPYFSAGDLSDVAADLDKAERELMLSAGMDTAEAQRFLAEDSGNVDDAGNFSIQVLNTALMRSHNLQLVQDSASLRRALQAIDGDRASGGGSSMTTPAATPTLADECEGLVLNLSAHWYAIRLVFGEYYDINSTLKAPKRISRFFLTAYIAQLQAEGWSVFTVQGTLPHPIKDFRSMGERRNWYVIGEDVEGGEKETQSATTKAAASSGFQAFSGTGAQLSGEAAQSDSSASADQDSEEEQLRKAIMMSLEPETVAATLVPPVPEPERGSPGSVRLQLKLPDGKRLQRRFHQDEQVQSVFAFLAQSWGPSDASGVRLVGSGRERSAEGGESDGALTLDADGSKSLLDAGLSPSASLNCWAPPGSF